MRENDVSLMLRYAIEETENTPPDKWPTDMLNDLAFSVVPRGAPVQLCSDKYYELPEVRGTSASITEYIGSASLGGYFSGFVKVQYSDRSIPEIEYEVNELTVWVDVGGGPAVLVPVQHLTLFEADTRKPSMLLYEDDVAQEIDSLIADGPIDLAGLNELFSNLDPEGMRTQLLLDYLNEILYLPNILTLMTVDKVFHIGDRKSEDIEGGDEVVQIVTPDTGKSFTALGVIFDDDKRQLMLCVNARTSSGELVKVPVTGIREIIQTI